MGLLSPETKNILLPVFICPVCLPHGAHMCSHYEYNSNKSLTLETSLEKSMK